MTSGTIGWLMVGALVLVGLVLRAREERQLRPGLWNGAAARKAWGERMHSPARRVRPATPTPRRGA